MAGDEHPNTARAVTHERANQVQELEEYEGFDPVPFTLLLTAADAKRLGDRVRKKQRSPANKATPEPRNK